VNSPGEYHRPEKFLRKREVSGKVKRKASGERGDFYFFPMERFLGKGKGVEGERKLLIRRNPSRIPAKADWRKGECFCF